MTICRVQMVQKGTEQDSREMRSNKIFTKEMTQISIPLIFISCQLALISMLEDFTGITSFMRHKVPVKKVLLAL